MTSLSQAKKRFVTECNTLSLKGDALVLALLPHVRGLVEAAYLPQMGLRRHLDDLAADGAVGLVEAVRCGAHPAEIADRLLAHVEANRLRAILAKHTRVRDDGELSPCALPNPEERMIELEGGNTTASGPIPFPTTRDLKLALAKLSEQDRLLVHLYYRRRKTIYEIAARVGRSGAAVAYRLRRIRDRLRVLSELPELTAHEIRRDLTGVIRPQCIVGYDPIDALAVYYETMSQSETARLLDVPQERVSYTVRQAVERLAGIHKLAKYHKAFDLISRHGLMWSRRTQ